jgi:hypothetical protein
MINVLLSDKAVTQLFSVVPDSVDDKINFRHCGRREVTCFLGRTEHGFLFILQTSAYCRCLRTQGAPPSMGPRHDSLARLPGLQGGLVFLSISSILLGLVDS